MRAFKLDKQGDLIIHNGELVMIKGHEELTRSIERILTTNLKEWFLDIDFGLDYSAISGKGKSVESIKIAIIEAIYQDPRIRQAEINIVELNNGRELRVEGIATDIEGSEIDLSELGVIVIG